MKHHRTGNLLYLVMLLVVPYFARAVDFKDRRSAEKFLDEDLNVVGKMRGKAVDYMK